MSNMPVVVVGAGPQGPAAASHLLEHGLQFSASSTEQSYR